MNIATYVATGQLKFDCIYVAMYKITILSVAILYIATIFLQSNSQNMDLYCIAPNFRSLKFS